MTEPETDTVLFRQFSQSPFIETVNCFRKSARDGDSVQVLEIWKETKTNVVLLDFKEQVRATRELKHAHSRYRVRWMITTKESRAGITSKSWEQLWSGHREAQYIVHKIILSLMSKISRSDYNVTYYIHIHLSAIWINRSKHTKLSNSSVVKRKFLKKRIKASDFSHLFRRRTKSLARTTH